MPTTIIMPRQGQSVESCILSQWHKSVGDAVAADDLLFTYETDKATFDETAKENGILLAVFAQEGDDIPVLQPVCVIGQAGETIPENLVGRDPLGAPPSPEPMMISTKTPEIVPVSTTESVPSGAVSPRAKNLAARSGINPAALAGTGPRGRVIERDVVSGVGAAVPGRPPSPSPAVQSVPHTGIRKAIAKAMHHSLSAMAQLTLHSSFDASDLFRFRQQCKDTGKPAPTVTDAIVYAASRVLANHPELNAHYYDDRLERFGAVNCGLAVDTERGLLVPTVFGTEGKTLDAIGKEIKDLAAVCRTGKINPDLLKGGTFTVTNLGSMGVEAFTPVINPPQVAILGVCAVTDRPRMTGKGFELYPAMGLSLTFDHRAVDGAPAARFLADLAKYLERFGAEVAP
jgi:pyruvate dehydrogenase E2 component (dihydrolipoamide acetyltransferase)